MSKRQPHPMLAKLKAQPIEEEDDDYYSEEEEDSELTLWIRKNTSTAGKSVSQVIQEGRNFISTMVNRFDEEHDTDFSMPEDDEEEFFKPYDDIDEYEVSVRSPAVTRTMFDQELNILKQGIIEEKVELNTDKVANQPYSDYDKQINDAIKAVPKNKKLTDDQIKAVHVNIIDNIANDYKSRLKPLNLDKSTIKADTLSPEIRKIVFFKDKDKEVSSKLFRSIRFVYTNQPAVINKLLKEDERIFDFSQVIKDNQAEFDRYLIYIKSINRLDLIYQWYKYKFWNNVEHMIDKIVIFTNPNQVPNQFRTKSNELILIFTPLELDGRRAMRRMMELSACYNFARKYVHYQDGRRVLRLINKLVFVQCPRDKDKQSEKEASPEVPPPKKRKGRPAGSTKSRKSVKKDRKPPGSPSYRLNSPVNKQGDQEEDQEQAPKT